MHGFNFFRICLGQFHVITVQFLVSILKIAIFNQLHLKLKVLNKESQKHNYKLQVQNIQIVLWVLKFLPLLNVKHNPFNLTRRCERISDRKGVFQQYFNIKRSVLRRHSSSVSVQGMVSSETSCFAWPGRGPRRPESRQSARTFSVKIQQ